ncbi:hypothetical protein ACJJIU_01455 [Microbulbifer sp. CnH-101-E]|uniref:Immunity protein 30 domain-containing protein n=1 Tax=Microbulbifer variabilis TaxID=266805 RepID=A0ABY4VEL7_9GAMM|nr:hypothetical protein [Microbulbifer variabilis]USD22649.1 hypothetical protein MJO52_05815 [Microbulbifer variabilis]
MDDYHRAVFSDNKDEVTEALFAAISQRDFFLDNAEIEKLALKFNDDKVSGWVFAYRVYKYSEDRNTLLKSNINNENPRIREHVCDIIGDEHIESLRGELITLFDDPVNYVSEAAKYNYSEMF